MTELEKLQSNGRELIFTPQHCRRCIDILEARAMAAAAEGIELPVEQLAAQVATISRATTFLELCGREILQDGFRKDREKYERSIAQDIAES